VRFSATDFDTWTHVELTEPMPYSISQAEAGEQEALERGRRRPPEMGG
jgi:hypothetical protein